MSKSNGRTQVPTLWYNLLLYLQEGTYLLLG